MIACDAFRDEDGAEMSRTRPILAGPTKATGTSMAQQRIVVLDNPPLERDPWADAVFQAADILPVDNAQISKTMAADPETLKLLLANADAMPGPNAPLAAKYRAALDQLHGDAPRLGLWGTTWLSYLDGVDACVLDWSEVEKRAAAPGVAAGDGEMFRRQSRDFVHASTDRLADGRLLELETGLPQDARIARTLDFLRSLGLD